MPPTDPNFLAHLGMILMPHTSVAPSLAAHQVDFYTIKTCIHLVPPVPSYGLLRTPVPTWEVTGASRYRIRFKQPRINHYGH